MEVSRTMTNEEGLFGLVIAIFVIYAFFIPCLIALFTLFVNLISSRLADQRNRFLVSTTIVLFILLISLVTPVSRYNSIYGIPMFFIVTLIACSHVMTAAVFEKYLEIKWLNAGLFISAVTSSVIVIVSYMSIVSSYFDALGRLQYIFHFSVSLLVSVCVLTGARKITKKRV